MGKEPAPELCSAGCLGQRRQELAQPIPLETAEAGTAPDRMSTLPTHTVAQCRPGCSPHIKPLHSSPVLVTQQSWLIHWLLPRSTCASHLLTPVITSNITMAQACADLSACPGGSASTSHPSSTMPSPGGPHELTLLGPRALWAVHLPLRQSLLGRLVDQGGKGKVEASVSTRLIRDEGSGHRSLAVHTILQR